MEKTIKLSKEEFDFINFMLNDIQTSPMTREGYGYRIMAFHIQKKINGERMPENVHKEFEKVQRERIKKYIDNITKKIAFEKGSKNDNN